MQNTARWHFLHQLLTSRVTLYTDFLIDGRRIGLFRGAKNYDWGAGAWDPNYILGVDFLTMIFFNLKNSG